MMALAESLVVWVPFRCSSGGRSRPTALADSSESGGVYVRKGQDVDSILWGEGQ